MRKSQIAIWALCLIGLSQAVMADTFTTKRSGSAVDITIWKAGRDGTISLAAGSAHVIGAGTAFSKIYLPAPGMAVLTDADGTTVLGTVQSIEDDTHLTLTAPAGADLADVPFTTESLPTLTDDIVITAGDSIFANIADIPNDAFGAHHVTIEGTLTTDVLSFNINGNLTINAGGKLQTNYRTRVIFDGISTIGGTAAITLAYMRVIKEVDGGGSITLGNDVTVCNILEMEGGTINTAGHTLTLGISADYPGTFQLSPAGHPQILGTINGTFRRWFGPAPITNFDFSGLFPMGAGGVFRKLWIRNPAGASGTITVTHTDTPNITPISISDGGIPFSNRYNMNWTIAPGNGYSGTADVQIQESGLTLATSPVDNLTVSLAATTAPGTYTPASIVAGDTVVTRTGLDAAGLANTFYIAGTSDALPLPVELQTFTAQPRAGSILLNWKTATERDNYGFEIERRPAVAEGKDVASSWTRIGFVEGHGTTNAPQSYTYADVVPSGTYEYRLKQIDRSGHVEYSNAIEIAAALTPADYGLAQNFPNPFNPATTIRFAVANTQQAVVKVYNMLGQEVRTIFNGVVPAGVLQTVVFDARDLPSGVYYYALRSGGQTSVKRMELLR